MRFSLSWILKKSVLPRRIAGPCFVNINRRVCFVTLVAMERFIVGRTKYPIVIRFIKRQARVPNFWIDLDRKLVFTRVVLHCQRQRIPGERHRDRHVSPRCIHRARRKYSRDRCASLQNFHDPRPALRLHHTCIFRHTHPEVELLRTLHRTQQRVRCKPIRCGLRHQIRVRLRIGVQNTRTNYCSLRATQRRARPIDRCKRHTDPRNTYPFTQPLRDQHPYNRGHRLKPTPSFDQTQINRHALTRGTLNRNRFRRFDHPAFSFPEIDLRRIVLRITRDRLARRQLRQATRRTIHHFREHFSRELYGFFRAQALVLGLRFFTGEHRFRTIPAHFFGFGRTLATK